MPPDAVKTSWLMQLLDQIHCTLERFVREASLDELESPNLESAAVHEAAGYLKELELAPSAARLEHYNCQLDNSCMDAYLCDRARGQSAEYQEWLTRTLGRYPAPGESEHEHGDLQRTLRIAIVGSASQMADFVRKLQRELADDESQIPGATEKATVQPKKRERQRSAKRSGRKEFKRAREDTIAEAIRGLAREGQTVTSAAVSKKCTGQDGKQIPEGTIRQSNAWRDRTIIMREVSGTHEQYERSDYYSPPDDDIVDGSVVSPLEELINREDAVEF